MVPYVRYFLSPHEGGIILLIYFTDFLQAIDVGLVDVFDAPAAAVVAAGTELTVDAARPPQGLMDDSQTFFPRGVFYQYGFHCIYPPLKTDWFLHGFCYAPSQML